MFACQCHVQDTCLHAPVKSKWWEAVKLTLICAGCAGGYPEDISITEHALVFKILIRSYCWLMTEGP